MLSFRLIAITSFIQVQSGEGIPIPRPLLPEEPHISEIKCPNQLAKAQNNLLKTLFPLSSNLSSAFCNDISSPLDTK